MALSAKPFHISVVLALATTGVTAANARSLNRPSPLDRLSDVVQFGVPRDTKFVFCGEEDYPERSIKHLYVSPPSPPVVQESATFTPQSTQPPEGLPCTKIPVKKEPLKKEWKKPVIQYERKPANKPK